MVEKESLQEEQEEEQEEQEEVQEDNDVTQQFDQNENTNDDEDDDDDDDDDDDEEVVVRMSNANEIIDQMTTITADNSAMPPFVEQIENVDAPLEDFVAVAGDFIDTSIVEVTFSFSVFLLFALIVVCDLCC
jgi:hypothetical protein